VVTSGRVEAFAAIGASIWAAYRGEGEGVYEGVGGEGKVGGGWGLLLLMQIGLARPPESVTRFILLLFCEKYHTP
jgi:hypothetical protein